MKVVKISIHIPLVCGTLCVVKAKLRFTAAQLYIPTVISTTPKVNVDSSGSCRPNRTSLASSIDWSVIRHRHRTGVCSILHSGQGFTVLTPVQNTNLRLKRTARSPEWY
ncbi:hypothetical protein CEXT_369431 [Caerostris extrusa]|uniref:Secreted protein n=1 Tax=Caerostris extrusa TaxID=172846 RepID=A0AAV4SRP4_CAEEX|nr:hypothetical protein CEXT_369431 [Caerostris extrusa]